jgi:HSP20 family molecular chaperone IbpA
LGFDHLENALDRISKSGSDSYPPYDIMRTEENGIRISLAVAGFGADELDVTVQDRQLGVHGRRKESAEPVYLHRGIATRQFQRSFVLADGLEVKEASLENGMLHIDLERHAPEVEIRRVKIEDRSR